MSISAFSLRYRKWYHILCKQIHWALFVWLDHIIKVSWLLTPVMLVILQTTKGIENWSSVNNLTISIILYWIVQILSIFSILHHNQTIIIHLPDIPLFTFSPNIVILPCNISLSGIIMIQSSSDCSDVIQLKHCTV